MKKSILPTGTVAIYKDHLNPDSVLNGRVGIVTGHSDYRGIRKYSIKIVACPDWYSDNLKRLQVGKHTAWYEEDFSFLPEESCGSK